jgi:prepilin-type N-terminal cleavage/methylation domain-containing protein
MAQSKPQELGQRAAFTLIELLVVISIISLLISILLPSLSRAREQAKGVHCLARLKDIGNGIAAYENISEGKLPPSRWFPKPEDLNEPTAPRARPVEYGWMETLFAYLYQEEVRLTDSYPVLRNIEGQRWQKYFLCRSAGVDGISSGHYRVYLPSWSASTYALDRDGRYGDRTRANPDSSASRERIRPKLPLIGDANENSERGDGLGDDDCSFIDAGEADYAGTDGYNGNRFSDRHHGGANFLFQDLHGEWSGQLRAELARDFDLNGVLDVERQP